MTTITLYKYTREDGGTTTSPVKPEIDCNELVRVVADKDKILVLPDGTQTFCADLDSADGITEIDHVVEMPDDIREEYK